MGAKTKLKKDFSAYLGAELAKRRKTNPRYSLRAFSRYLGINPATLSKVLSGKRRVTRKFILKTAHRLGLNPRSVEVYLPQGPLTRKQRQSRLAFSPSKYEALAEEHFMAMSDWLHLAVLELIHLKTFQPDLKWIAEVLCVPLQEVKSCTETLVRLGMLEISPSGRWKDLTTGRVSSYGEFRHPRANEASRELQRKFLKKALNALSEIPAERRNQSSMTMAIDSSKLPEAIEMITKFRRGLCEFLKGELKSRDQVYTLTISVYPLTQI